ncbi:MAG: hypothetical protein ACLFWB_10930 [Armatimonadota bacterium]
MIAMRAVEALRQERPAVFVSLPRNDMALARAAVEGGADGLKVHINLHHHAANLRFGSWEEEADVIQSIMDLGLPVGIVPGTAEKMCTPEDMLAMAAAGIDFVDAYLHDMPAWMLNTETDIHIMGAASWRDIEPEGTLSGLELLPQVRMVEASVIPHDGYEEALNAADVRTYARLVALLRESDIPVIVPTQRTIAPSEVSALHKVGVRGILIGAIVTGKEPETISQATEQFREATEALA